GRRPFAASRHGRCHSAGNYWQEPLARPPRRPSRRGGRGPRIGILRRASRVVHNALKIFSFSRNCEFRGLRVTRCKLLEFQTFSGGLAWTVLMYEPRTGPVTSTQKR